MIKAVIFDMDGVVLDSEKYWPIFLANFYTGIIPGFDRALMPNTMGMGFYSVYEVLKERFTFDMQREEFILKGIEGAKQKVYSFAQLMPGFLEFILYTREQGRKTALGTSSSYGIVNRVFETHTGLPMLLDAVVTADDVGGRSKPFPDIFLKAAERLNLAPESCVVIEDADNGITAAKAAGMRVYAFRNGMNEHQSLDGADFIFEDFSKLTI